MYGVYAVCLILIPPWMSTVDEFGVRTISFMGHLNRTAFCLVAAFAVYAHLKAMTTDPGAVPPDAQPIPTIDDEPLKSKSSTDPNDTGNGTGTNGVEEGVNGDDPLGMMPASVIPPKRKGKRLCRRCNAFKPKRAHHCSICRRCIIKMDRKYFRRKKG
jgi:palmitoyltransferase